MHPDTARNVDYPLTPGAGTFGLPIPALYGLMESDITRDAYVPAIPEGAGKPLFLDEILTYLRVKVPASGLRTCGTIETFCFVPCSPS